MSGADTEQTVGLVCSPGGHLTELLELSDAFSECRCFYICYDSDTSRRIEDSYRVPNRPYNPIQFVANLFRFARIFRKEQPDSIVSTGAEIAIPAFFTARFLQIPTLYIECGCQVTTPSLTGRILSRIATEVYVQWPELVEAYGGRAVYRGSLIDEHRP